MTVCGEPRSAWSAPWSSPPPQPSFSVAPRPRVVAHPAPTAGRGQGPGVGASPTSRSPISTSCWRSPATGSRARPTTTPCCVRLVELARTDDLASRIVLQRVLPGLLATVRRRRQPGRLRRDVRGARRRRMAGDPVVPDGAPPDPRRRQHRARRLVPGVHRPGPAPARPPRCRSTRRRSTRPRRRPRPAPVRSWPPLLADARAAGVPPADLDLVRHLVRPAPPPPSPPSAT